MNRKLINISLCVIVVLSASIAHASRQDAVLETDLFILNFPAGFKPLQIKPQKKEAGDFAYEYIESGKEKQKSILIIVTAKRSTDIKNGDANGILYIITSALREQSLTPNKCESQASFIIKTTIGNSDAFFFEKRSKNCKVSIERYWSVFKEGHFITFYIAKPDGGSVDLFNSVQEAIKQVRFK